MRDPFPIVCRLGERLQWRDTKAIVLMAALSGPWEGAASQLADALGVHPDLQEEIRLEALRHEAEGLIHYPQAINGVAA